MLAMSKNNVFTQKTKLRKSTMNGTNRMFDKILNCDNLFKFNSDKKCYKNKNIYKKVSMKKLTEVETNFSIVNLPTRSNSKFKSNLEISSILPKISQAEMCRNHTTKSINRVKTARPKVLANNIPRYKLFERKKSNENQNKRKFSHNIELRENSNKTKTRLFLKTENNWNVNNEESKLSPQITVNYFENKKYASLTQKGFISEDKEKEENQDVTLIMENIFGIKNFNIYGVMDGHGSNGHLVSKFIKEKIENFFNDKSNIIRKKSKYNFVFDINYIKKKLCKNNYKLIKDLYKNIDEELSTEIFDVHFSGSTCILLFQLNNFLISANTGDSKAIMVKNNNEFIELNEEHKPENPIEKNRIENAGGVVSQCNDKYDDGLFGGPFRVWKKGCDYPGISMSRSIGDIVSKELGVISEPDIITFDIRDDCNYIILGSDGVWEYLSSERVVNIAKRFYKKRDGEKMCRDIIHRSTDLFLENEHRIDDISVSIIYLDDIK